MKNILVPVDHSEQMEQVLTAARELARPLEAKLWMIHVAAPDPEFVGYAPGPDTVRHQVAKQLHDEHQQLQDLTQTLRDEGFDATALAIQGPTVDRILSEIDKLDIDLVIMGSHGHGAVYRVVVGSVSEGVLRRSPCPVLIVPPANRRGK